MMLSLGRDYNGRYGDIHCIDGMEFEEPERGRVHNELFLEAVRRAKQSEVTLILVRDNNSQIAIEYFVLP